MSDTLRNALAPNGQRLGDLQIVILDYLLMKGHIFYMEKAREKKEI